MNNPAAAVPVDPRAQGAPVAPVPLLSSTEYRLLVEHSPVMIWRSGTDAKCDYFNQTWLDFTGRTLEQETGDGWAEGVHPDDFEPCVRHYLDHFGRRAAFEMEYRLRRHDGVYRWIFDRGVPFADDSGTFAGFIGSCVDVDERRKAQEAARQRSEEQLALARDFEKWILAIVSHDIRNPLAAVHAAAQRLKLIDDRSGELGKHVAIVARGVSRIQHLVGDLLDVSRERAGSGVPIAPRPTDLRAICWQAIEELKAIAPDRRISFECEADGQGEWDEQRVLQAISNLISNAVKHGTPGCTVRVRLGSDPQRVVVEVRNEGHIAPDLLPRIFEPFRSRQQGGGGTDGLGLGLFISKAIARAHGGDLQLESGGNVTVSRLVIPRRAAAQAQAPGASAQG